MAFDACMIMYIVYIQYSILQVIALSVGVFSYFIHVLNVVLNFGLASQSKVIFTFIFKCFEL